MTAGGLPHSHGGEACLDVSGPKNDIGEAVPRSYMGDLRRARRSLARDLFWRSDVEARLVALRSGRRPCLASRVAVWPGRLAIREACCSPSESGDRLDALPRVSLRCTLGFIGLSPLATYADVLRQACHTRSPKLF